MRGRSPMARLAGAVVAVVALTGAAAPGTARASGPTATVRSSTTSTTPAPPTAVTPTTVTPTTVAPTTVAPTTVAPSTTTTTGASAPPAPTTTTARRPATTSTTAAAATTTVPARTPTTGVPRVPTGGGTPPAKVKRPAGPAAPAGLGALERAVATGMARLDAVDTYLQDEAVARGDRLGVGAAQADVAGAQQASAVATGGVGQARRQEAAAEHRLTEMAVAVYTGSAYVAPDQVARGPAGPLGTRGQEAADADVMVSLVVDHDETEVAEAQRGVGRAESAATAAADRVGLAEAGLRRAEAALQTADADTGAAATIALAARVPAAAASSAPSILGPSVVDASLLAGWYASTGERPATTVRMAQLAADYAAAGRATGVRDDLAFAQSVVETGYFSFPSGGQLTGADNNFAGIGACDSCAHGWSFPSARTGVTAQLELLEAYASPRPVATPLVGSVGIGGCCPTWEALSGHWATNPDYGLEILGVYDRILAWALPRRLAAAGLG